MAEQAVHVPAGYRMDAKGRLVPEEMIKPIDLERDRLVQEIVAKGKALNKALLDFKLATFGDIEAFITLSAEQYQAKVGGKKGNASWSASTVATRSFGPWPTTSPSTSACRRPRR